MPGTKAMKVTKKYCADLLDRHELSVEVADNSEQFSLNLLKKILNSADLNSRFRVSWDPGSYEDDGDTWDLIGPGLPFGTVYYYRREDAEGDRDRLNAILREHFGHVERRAEYTPEAHLAKSLLDKPCCPACGSAELQTDEHSFKGATCIVFKGCHACNAEWTEKYVFQGYHDLRID
jgi:hypothetical protein